jgi:hypothetical protein
LNIKTLDVSKELVDFKAQKVLKKALSVFGEIDCLDEQVTALNHFKTYFKKHQFSSEFYVVTLNMSKNKKLHSYFGIDDAPVFYYALYLNDFELYIGIHGLCTKEDVLKRVSMMLNFPSYTMELQHTNIEDDEFFNMTIMNVMEYLEQQNLKQLFFEDPYLMSLVKTSCIIIDEDEILF